MSGWVDSGSGVRTGGAVGSWTPANGTGAGCVIVEVGGWRLGYRSIQALDSRQSKLQCTIHGLAATLSG